MFKKLSMSLHSKSHKVESDSYYNAHHDSYNRDSMIDPTSVDMAASAGYNTRDNYIGPNMSTMAINKPVTHINEPEHHQHEQYNTSYHHYTNNNDYYNQQNHSENDLKPPPLTIDSYQETARNSLTSFSPASIPSPITPADHHNHSQNAAAAKQQQQQPVDEIEALVHEGIAFHEKGQLEKATSLFRIGAEKGNPIGMFLYGVSLRHGWGCKKNEHAAFQYLQKAAEHAVEDLGKFSTAVKVSAAKGELIMAVYELAVSFRHGWGCKKSKETAVHYFKIAADLGDPDAQNDLGHCYYHGHGTKKDLSLAAKYYRKADKQGHGIMGNSWIWKPKYDPPTTTK